jgi:4-hydroxy-tetrahydrodipicolinate synthase
MTFLSGLSAFPITPSDEHGSINTSGLQHLVRRLLTAEVDSIGLLGSTGTYMYLSREQRRLAIESAMHETGGSTPLVVGIGALRTDEAVRLALDAKAAGANAGLLAAVSYTPLNDAEVYEHFVTVARESGLPIVIYDNPTTTHFQFTPDLISRLAAVPGILGVKSPAGSPSQTPDHLAKLRSLTSTNFSIGYSVDANSLEALISGADTWYSVLAGIFPKVCVKAAKAAKIGDFGEVRRLDKELAPVWDLYKQFTSFRVVYALAELLQICRTEPPRPILPLTGSDLRQVETVLKSLPAEVVQ